MLTPCVAVCQFDAHTNICKGCGRTRQQVAEWSTYSDDKRLDMMKEFGYGKERKGRHAKYEERVRRYDRG